MKTDEKNNNGLKKVVLSVNDVNAMTGLSKSYIRNLIRQRKLKANKIGRRTVIFPSDLQEFIQQVAKPL